MFIKRSAFLLLTGVLAQQACTAAKSDDPDTGGTGGDGGSTTSAGAGAGGAPDNQAGSSMSAAGADEGGAPSGAGGAGLGGAGLGGAGLGGAALGGESSGGVGGATGGAGSGEGGMTSCTGDVGTPGTCSTICTDESAQLWCATYMEGLKLGVAEAASDCLAEGTKCDDFDYECVRTALAGACPDPGLDEFCTAAVAACNPNDPIDMAGCHALVDGLNEIGITSVSSCVDEGGCQFGLWSCVESL